MYSTAVEREEGCQTIAMREAELSMFPQVADCKAALLTVSFRDAPLGADPESILPARLALGPFARFKKTKRTSFIFANAASRTRAVVVLDSGLARFTRTPE